MADVAVILRLLLHHVLLFEVFDLLLGREDILRLLILEHHVGLILVKSRLQRNKLAHSAVDLREARRGFAELPSSIAAGVVVLLLH